MQTFRLRCCDLLMLRRLYTECSLCMFPSFLGECRQLFTPLGITILRSWRLSRFFLRLLPLTNNARKLALQQTGQML